MLLTAEILLHYQRCNRRAFLDIYGDKTQKDPYTNFQLKLQQERFDHQQFILAEQHRQGITLPHQPQYPKRDWKAGADATLALMQQGVDRIYKGVLLVKGGEENSQFPVSLVSHPDLLIKQPGQSNFGDWLYVPTDIYISKRPKQEYQVIAAYHTQLLAITQGAWPEKAWLNLREKGDYEVDLWRLLPQMQQLLDECLQVLISEQEPEVFISRQQCSLCPWLSSCYAIAKSTQHLSLLPGVSPVRYQHLKSLGITTLESLVEINPVYLQPVIEGKVAEQVVRQAQSFLNKDVILIPNSPYFSSEKIFSNTIEFYFDIEAQPNINLDYLLGVLCVDKEANTESFYGFMAENSEQEELIWQQFLTLVLAYPHAPIYHFSPYEYDTVKRLAKLYKTPSYQVQPLLSRFVDLHPIITSSVTLPVEGYSLKAIANWLGFKWRDAQASGSQCICWYDDWLKTGDRTLLEYILRYNEDDCRATHYVKNWLYKQLLIEQ